MVSIKTVFIRDELNYVSSEFNQTCVFIKRQTAVFFKIYWIVFVHGVLKSQVTSDTLLSAFTFGFNGNCIWLWPWWESQGKCQMDLVMALAAGADLSHGLSLLKAVSEGRKSWLNRCLINKCLPSEHATSAAHLPPRTVIIVCLTNRLSSLVSEWIQLSPIEVLTMKIL